MFSSSQPLNQQAGEATSGLWRTTSLGNTKSDRVSTTNWSPCKVDQSGRAQLSRLVGLARHQSVVEPQLFEKYKHKYKHQITETHRSRPPCDALRLQAALESAARGPVHTQPPHALIIPFVLVGWRDVVQPLHMPPMAGRRKM
jgi:hypothetical protein